MYVHGDNLQQKENGDRKYSDAESKAYLAEIREKYDTWRSANIALRGPLIEGVEARDIEILTERTRLFSEYKDFIDQQKYAEKFDSRSNLHSSVLEEFMYYLFKDLIQDFSTSAIIGKAHTFKDIFFQAANFRQMVSSPCLRIETKDHDFIIGVNIDSNFKCTGQEVAENAQIQIPAVAIECKTYLDKTMLEGSSTAAEQLKMRNPNALYFVVSEWLKLTENINLRKFKVDQIYILRKQKNTDREFRYLPGYVKNPVFPEVVHHLFFQVKAYLCKDWDSGVASGLDRGWLL